MRGFIQLQTHKLCDENDLKIILLLNWLFSLHLYMISKLERMSFKAVLKYI